MGHLTPKDEKRIIKLIEEWSEPKLTWPLLVEACKEKLGISRARQSLMNLPAVDLAMKNCKAALKAQKLKPGWISGSRLPSLFLVELGALISVASTIVPWRNDKPRSPR